MIALSTISLDQLAALDLDGLAELLLDPRAGRSTFVAAQKVYLPGCQLTQELLPGCQQSQEYLPGVQAQQVTD